MKAGDILECVDAKDAPILREGEKYIAMRVYGEFVDVGVLPGEKHPGFFQRRFRRVPQTDISVFQAMLPRELCDLQSSN